MSSHTVHIIVYNYKLLETKTAVVTTLDDDAVSNDAGAKSRWRQSIAQQYADSEEGWSADDVDIIIDPNPIEAPEAPLPQMESFDISVVYKNTRTGVGGGAKVTTTDIDAVSDSTEAQEHWILRIRKKFSQREGWALSDTSVEVDGKSTVN